MSWTRDDANDRIDRGAGGGASRSFEAMYRRYVMGRGRREIGV